MRAHKERKRGQYLRFPHRKKVSGTISGRRTKVNKRDEGNGNSGNKQNRGQSAL